MTNDKQLDYLISVLYETVLAPSRWQEAVELCGYYMGGVESQLGTMAKKDNTVMVYVISETTFSMQDAAEYANYYFPLDPRSSCLWGVSANGNVAITFMIRISLTATSFTRIF